MRSRPVPSPSAQICASTVSTPWPTEAAQVITSIVPSPPSVMRTSSTDRAHSSQRKSQAPGRPSRPLADAGLQLCRRDGRLKVEIDAGSPYRRELIWPAQNNRSAIWRLVMRSINILATQRISTADRAKIEAADPAVQLIDAGGWFDGEIRETFTAYAAARYLAPHSTGSGSREERDRLLAEAEVILGGWPFPLALCARAPRLKWLHQRQAGASNLLGSDLWGSGVVVTTSRGASNPLPIAEYAIAGILHFAKGFNRAAIDREAGAFDHRGYRPLLLQGKTVCVVGAGGIGLEVGRLCAALGMRVVGTRRREQPGALPQGFSEVGGADAIDRFLPESDFVVICCQCNGRRKRPVCSTRTARLMPSISSESR